MSRRSRNRTTVPERSDRVRVIVRGPTDPQEADALRRAIIRDLAGLAVDLLAEGRLPPLPVAGSDRSKP